MLYLGKGTPGAEQDVVELLDCWEKVEKMTDIAFTHYNHCSFVQATSIQ